MLWLSDLAADHNMVIDLHVEATTTTLTQLATLLSHNTNTKIIWDHAGWTNLTTSLATAAVFSQMLADHANLYLSLKMRAGEEGESTSPVYSDGTIKSDWYAMLTTYADRIMVGNDAKYRDSAATVEQAFESSYSPLNAMLEQLPSATAVQIRYGTAKTLFGL
jgi:predicted TIM-barrel fold metal-dependent hydrolase